MLDTNQLTSGLEGRVILPGDAEYDQARQVMYGGVDKRPAVMVRCRSAADVQKALAFARANGLEIAVRSGGHSAAGHSTTEGGLVIDLREMNRIELDVSGKTAWAGPGVTAAQFSEEAAKHGLAVGFGDAGTVGLGGIVTGGGVGYLSRKYGLSIDSLLAAEVVTADGTLVTADADTNADLFWAIRGGGGNFGILTRLKFRLSDLPDFTGGMLLLPATAETIAGFVRLAIEASENLSTIANIMPAPPMPFLKPEMVGMPVIMGMMAYSGPPEDAKAALAPFRALAAPLADFVNAGPITSMYPPEDPDYHPTAASKNLFTGGIGKAEAATILKYLKDSDASLRVAQLRVMGGAVNRVPADATAYAHRGKAIMVNVAAFYDGEADKPKKQAWVDAFSAALAKGDTDAYVNFVGDEGAERVRAAYPGATWDRLRQIKRKYDPDNVFRLNQNIPPG
jgi:FAD/FMN-containing dehydrogenase